MKAGELRSDGLTDVTLEFSNPNGGLIQTRVYYIGEGTLRAGPVRVEPVRPLVQNPGRLPDWPKMLAWVLATIVAGWLLVVGMRRAQRAADGSASRTSRELADVGEDAQREFFERLARRYDSRFLRSRWPRNQQLKGRLVAEALGEELHEGPVVEVGCGTGQIAGELLATYPDLQYVGVDLSPGMLDVARRRLAHFGDRVTLRVSEGGELPVNDSLLAGAFGIDVLHHVDEPRSSCTSCASPCDRAHR